MENRKQYTLKPGERMLAVDPNRAQAVFLLAIEAPDAAARLAILDFECAGNVDLRRRVEELLTAHETSGSFLNFPAVPPVSPSNVFQRGPRGAAAEPAQTTGDTPRNVSPGKIIAGRYRLLELIGEGGMGTVWMTEQRVPVKRLVALKLIKPGMASKTVLARFEAERQALALMDHTNIAKIFDGGTTDDGCPFFVMELVKGIPLTQYCDERRLSIQARLQLFLQVCQAVQHAHQKGIIHRDLKPTNILVTEHDGRPVPKVIDFGLAKALQGQYALTDQTLYTFFGGAVGTPLYMAPEQVGINSLDVDTRTDVYALGVILYELLTGSTPLERQRFKEAAWDEVCRLIRDEEAPRPSTRLSASHALPSIAACRHTEPEKLGRLLHGDLDWIVLKALEKDRARRYETANGLAADVQRHLENEPVLARSPTTLYRFQKTVRRNKIAFIAASAVLAALVFGLGLSTWMFLEERTAHRRAVAAEQEQARLRIEAETNEKQAQTSAVKSQQTARFLKEMLRGVGPSVALGRDTTMLNDIVDQTAVRIGTDLKDQPEVQIELLQTLTQVYLDLALNKKAEETASETLQLARTRGAVENLAIADALQQLGRAQFFLRDLEAAETTTRQAIAMESKLRGSESLEAASAMLNLCDVLRTQSSTIDTAIYDKSRLGDADEAIRNCLAIRRKLLGDVHNDVAWALDAQSLLLNATDKRDEAEAASRESVAIRKQLYGENHPQLAASYFFLGHVLESKGQTEEAETCYRKAVSIDEKSQGRGWWRANYLVCLGRILQTEGKLDEAETCFRNSVDCVRKSMGPGHPDLPSHINALAQLLSLRGKLAEARALNEEAVVLYRRLPNRTAALSDGLATLVDALLRSEEFTAAEPFARECMQIREQQIPDNWRTFNIQSLLGGALLGQKKYDEAELLLISGFQGMHQREDQIPPAGKVRLQEALQRIVQLYDETDQPEKAVHWKEQLAALKLNTAQ